MNKMLSMLAMLLVSTAAVAGSFPEPPVVSVSEPGMLALLGIGIAAVLIAAKRK